MGYFAPARDRRLTIENNGGMSTSFFVWLGSGRARRRKVAPAGQWLDGAARAGLPVPPGAILLDEFFHLCLDKQLAAQRGETVRIPDAELLHNTLFYSVRLPRYERPVTVVPVESVTVNRAVDADDAQALTKALADAWAARPVAAAGRNDVVIMEQVTATSSGIATCLLAAEGDEVRTTSGEPGSSLWLPRLRPRQAAGGALPPFARRLQMLLRGVGRTLGPGDRIVYWADDGHICWLTGVLPAP